MRASVARSSSSVSFVLGELCVSTVEIIFVVVGIAALVLGMVAMGRALERHQARKLASSLIGQKCPSCGSSFRMDLLRTAQLKHGFEESCVGVVCTGCSKPWALLDNKLVGG